MKLGNTMKVEILNLNFSIKDSLKYIKNYWPTLYEGLHCWLCITWTVN